MGIVLGPYTCYLTYFMQTSYDDDEDDDDIILSTLRYDRILATDFVMYCN